MPRIRSIKPEFWTDGRNLELSDSCALFFIGLWNFVDDEGKKKIDLKQVAAELGGRWHVGKVKLFMSCLINSGQLILNSDTTWIQLTGWSHQRIDKPKQPEVKASDLQWLSKDESRKALEHSRTFHARIGEDRIDRIGSDISQAPTHSRKGAEAKAQKALAEIGKELNRKIWDVYAESYLERYKTEPVRNASVNSKISQLAKRLGDDSIPVVQFFLTHNDFTYVKALHPIGLCLAHAEALHTQWKRGKAVTGTDAKNFEKSMGQVQLARDLKAGGF